MTDAAGIQPLDDRCPRCGGGFHCGVNDAGPCPCAALKLTQELQGRLKERWSSCLCVSCLAALAGGAALEWDGTPAATPPA